ncbi:MAG: Ig-like domain-containing protein [bacterium]
MTLACSGGEITAPVTQTSSQNVPATIAITPPTPSDIAIGSSILLQIVVKNVAGADITSLPITWSSTDIAVATVSVSGLVTAMSAGTVIISATVGGRSASIPISVRAAGPAPITRVTVAVLATLSRGDSVSASAVAYDGGGSIVTGRAVTWSSRNAAIATVSSSGKVTAVSAGTTIIDALVDGVTGSATVTIVGPQISVAIVTVTMPDSDAVLAGQTVQASATVYDNFGQVMTNNVIAWSSSNNGIATVSVGGVITSVGSGTAIITASTGGKSGSAPFVVAIPSIAPVASVTISAPRTSIWVSQTLTLVPTLRDAAGVALANRPITWASPCPSVATVSAAGNVTAIALGSCVITATSGVVVGTFTLTVVATPIASLRIFTTATNIPVGVTSQLSATLLDSLGVSVVRPATWLSNNPAVVTVSATGLVTGVAAGTATITASSAGFNASVSMTVAAPLVPPVASVTVTAASTVLQPNQGTQATAVTKDSVNNVLTNRIINWSSSNNTVAFITPQGFINPQAAGTTTITAVSEGKTGSVTITVPAVATINVTSPQSTLQPTQTTQAAAVLLDASAAAAINRTIVWTSANTNVATVSSTGLVTAVAGGTAAITATSEGVTGTKTIVVPPVATVTLAAPITSLIPQQTSQVVATLRDASSAPTTNRSTIWTSTAPSVAMVSSNGLVTGLAIGTAVITATAEGKSGTVTITVIQPTVASIQINATHTQLLLSQTSQLSTIIMDNAGRATTTVTPTWTSSDPVKATISTTGVITAVGGGTSAVVTFTASVGNVSAAKNMTIIGHAVETVAALPQVFLNTAMVAAPAAGGKIISVAAGGSFQGALGSALPGDVIELANGATFTGNFILPNKNTTSSAWIVIRPASPSGLPAEGSRMTPAIAAAARLPILLSANNQGAINTALGAHHYRIVGLEISVTATNTGNTGLVRFGDGGGGGQTSLAMVAHDLILDRSYVHGSSTQNVRRAIGLNSASSSIIDSYISEIHELGGDAQAIAGWNGPGPYKIVNNYLEGSSENIQWGGSDPEITNLVPSDIEIRRNHFFKPTSWKGRWLVKNLYESKTSKRSLIEGNIFENNWQDGQNGSAIALKSTNQSGGCNWCGTQDVTFRYNLIRNTGAGFNLSASPDQFPAVPMQRVSITDNLITNIDVAPTFNGVGIGFMINQNPADLTLAHNTLIAPTYNAIAFGGPLSTPPVRLAFRDNIIGGGLYGVKGPGITAGNSTIHIFMPEGYFFSNALPTVPSNGYPTTSFYPTSVNAVGFVNPAGFDFRLASSSTLRSKGSDGRDVGADVDAVNAAIAGVIVP